MSNLTQREHQFEVFLREVNSIIFSKVRLTSSDFPDFNFFDYFELGITASATVEDFFDEILEDF